MQNFNAAHAALADVIAANASGQNVDTSTAQYHDALAKIGKPSTLDDLRASARLLLAVRDGIDGDLSEPEMQLMWSVVESLARTEA